MDTYIALVSAKFGRSWRMNIITAVIGPVISFLEPSQLPGEYAAHALKGPLFSSCDIPLA